MLRNAYRRKPGHASLSLKWAHLVGLPLEISSPRQTLYGIWGKIKISKAARQQFLQTDYTGCWAAQARVN